ncbi:unnamed protein product [marine sediment metagenome]|uniref:Uncharacterized protein n=1 Tax=marine sediment metagenome TaxID=412755 RepID=X0TK48_9ZZZZ
MVVRAGVVLHEIVSGYETHTNAMSWGFVILARVVGNDIIVRAE